MVGDYATPSASSNPPSTFLESNVASARARASRDWRGQSARISSAPVNCFLEGAERNQPFSTWNCVLEAGVLAKHRSTRRQEAGTAISEPAAVHGHIDVLRDRNLGTGTLNELPVCGRGAGNHTWVLERPAVIDNEIYVALVCRVDVEGKVKFGLDETGQRREFPEFVDSQTQRATLVLDRIVGTTPTPDPAERSRLSRLMRPHLEDNRGMNRNPLQSTGRYVAFRVADVGSHTHKLIVAGQQVGLTKLQPELGKTGVDIQENQRVGGRQADPDRPGSP